MTSPAAVSAALRRAGWLPIPTHTRDREGVRVTRTTVSGVVRVTADFDSSEIAGRRTDLLLETLEGAGFTVTRLDSNRLTVERA